jgi:hypothetical protein
LAAPCVTFVDTERVIVRSGSGTGVYTSWTSKSGSSILQENPIGYAVSFSGSFDNEGSDASASYQIGNQQQVDLGSSFSKSIYVGYSETLTFKVSSVDGYGNLSLNNFGYSVPGPLPAAGAASAIGISRRLRRRIKTVLKPRSSKHLLPSDPGAYLNLSASPQHAIPASFSYTTAPRLVAQSPLSSTVNRAGSASPTDPGGVVFRHGHTGSTSSRACT